MQNDQSIDYVVIGFAATGAMDIFEWIVFMNEENGEEVAENYWEGLIGIK